MRHDGAPSSGGSGDDESGQILDTFEGSAKEDLLMGCGMGEAGKSQG